MFDDTSHQDVARRKVKQALSLGRDVDVSELLRHFGLSSTDSEPYLVLHCVSGPLQKRVYGLVGAVETCIGSDSMNDIVQANARGVSPLHSRIAFDSDARCFRLYNQDTHYDGTLLRVPHGSPLVLQTGDVFWMGRTKCVVRGTRNLLAPKASFGRFSARMIRMAMGGSNKGLMAGVGVSAVAGSGSSGGSTGATPQTGGGGALAAGTVGGDEQASASASSNSANSKRSSSKRASNKRFSMRLKVRGGTDQQMIKVSKQAKKIAKPAASPRPGAAAQASPGRAVSPPVRVKSFKSHSVESRLHARTATQQQANCVIC
jgi:hypothetical protein